LTQKFKDLTFGKGSFPSLNQRFPPWLDFLPLGQNFSPGIPPNLGTLLYLPRIWGHLFQKAFTFFGRLGTDREKKRGTLQEKTQRAPLFPFEANNGPFFLGRFQSSAKIGEFFPQGKKPLVGGNRGPLFPKSPFHFGGKRPRTLFSLGGKPRHDLHFVFLHGIGNGSQKGGFTQHLGGFFTNRG